MSKLPNQRGLHIQYSFVMMPPLILLLMKFQPPRVCMGAVGWATMLALISIVPGALGKAEAAEPCDEARVRRVQAAYQAMKSFSGKFEQEDRRKDGQVDRARGSLAYRKPGRMRWMYEPPQEQLLVTDGSTVWLFDPLLDNVTVQPLKDLTQGTPLSFLLGVGNLTRDFACRDLTTPPPKDGLAYLELWPRSPIAGLAFIQLGVHAANGRIAALRMVDRQGNIRLLRLQDLRIGVKFPPGHFVFKIEKGMEVISK